MLHAYNEDTLFGELGRLNSPLAAGHYPLRRVQNHAIALQQNGHNRTGAVALMATDIVRIGRALLSVSDKTGLLDLARAL